MKIIRYAIVLAALWLMTGCSSMSFLPREGTAAKFNLATVEYVEQQNKSQNDVIVKELQGQIEEIVRKLTEVDREKLADLEAQIAQQSKMIADVQASADSTRSSVQMVSGRLLKDISDLKSANKNTQLFIDQFKADIERLPEEALREFNNAINAYLNSEPEK
ncbi:MAG: hypothetical protein GXO90_10890 [FCB group bacterium]|nr:hypothetical protein [FCB group bacterium]